jgi:hypothetical protein
LVLGRQPRRAKITSEQVGLPVGTGLRREEVGVLAGVSTDWYIRLEKGHIDGVSEDVLEAVARALRLDDAERAHLLDLARAASGQLPRLGKVPCSGCCPPVADLIGAGGVRPRPGGESELIHRRGRGRPC